MLIKGWHTSTVLYPKLPEPHYRLPIQRTSMPKGMQMHSLPFWFRSISPALPALTGRYEIN